MAPGLATNPTAPGVCTKAQFGTTEGAPGLFLPPTCPESSIIGNNKATVYAGGFDIPLEGTVYNLEPEEGHASEFGVALNAAPLRAAGLFAHTLIKGNVEWGKGSALAPKYVGTGTNAGDYHDYFEIEVSPALPLISSRLVFFGNENQETNKPDDFITNGTTCENPATSTTTLRLEDEEAVLTEPRPYTPPVLLKNCGAVPFEPGFALTPGHPRPGPARRLRHRSDGQSRTEEHDRQLRGQDDQRAAPRRHDAEPVRCRRPDRVHRKTGSDPQLHHGHRMSRQLGTRDRQPRSPDAARGLAQRQPLPGWP